MLLDPIWFSEKIITYNLNACPITLEFVIIYLNHPNTILIAKDLYLLNEELASLHQIFAEPKLVNVSGTFSNTDSKPSDQDYTQYFWVGVALAFAVQLTESDPTDLLNHWQRGAYWGCTMGLVECLARVTIFMLYTYTDVFDTPTLMLWYEVIIRGQFTVLYLDTFYSQNLLFLNEVGVMCELLHTINLTNLNTYPRVGV